VLIYRDVTSVFASRLVLDYSYSSKFTVVVMSIVICEISR